MWNLIELEDGAQHASRYIGCALSVALAATNPALSVALFNCIMLMWIDP